MDTFRKRVEEFKGLKGEEIKQTKAVWTEKRHNTV